MNILIVAGWVLLGVAVLAACGTPVVVGLTSLMAWDASDSHYPPKPRDPFPTRRIVLSAVGFLVALTVSIYVVGSLIPNDAAAHCGPGTHYLETGSGKSHSWICVAGA